mgnify:CR=1 FL=1
MTNTLLHCEYGSYMLLCKSLRAAQSSSIGWTIHPARSPFLSDTLGKGDHMPRWPIRTLAERFWSHVHFSPDGCWEWQGYCLPKGYGKFTFQDNGRTVSRLATHVSWFLMHNTYPMYQACHTCDNPSCVRPEHLFDGTQKDNIADAQRKGHLRYVAHSGEKNGRTRLSKESVLLIRMNRHWSAKHCAVRFRMARTTIHKIRQGKLWKAR